MSGMIDKLSGKKDSNDSDYKELFGLAGLRDDIPIFERILPKIDTDTKTLLNSKIEDLYNKFNLKGEEKNVFANYRALLRYKQIDKTPKIDLSRKGIKSLSEDEICQVFQQEIEGKSIGQCIEWFRIIEDNGWTGEILLKKTTKTVFKKMLLNDKQKHNYYEKLLKTFKKDKNEEASGSVYTTKVKKATVGVVGNNVKTNKINVNANEKKEKLGKDSDSSSSDSD